MRNFFMCKIQMWEKEKYGFHESRLGIMKAYWGHPRKIYFIGQVHILPWTNFDLEWFVYVWMSTIQANHNVSDRNIRLNIFMTYRHRCKIGYLKHRKQFLDESRCRLSFLLLTFHGGKWHLIYIYIFWYIFKHILKIWVPTFWILYNF